MTTSGRWAFEATPDEPDSASAGEPLRVGCHTGSLTKIRGEHLGLRSGNWSRIKSPEEKRVEQLINEPTGRRVDLKNDCLIRRNVMRWRPRFCPRGPPRSAREVRLRKVEA